MRSGWCVLASVAVLPGIGVSGARSSPPRQAFTYVDIWGQPSRSEEVAGRPLGTTIALFRGGVAAHLPRSTGPMRPLSVVAAHLLGHPGALLLARTRRVITAAGPIYLVPTTHGWVCEQGPNFRTCHRGLLAQGVTWNFYSTSTGLDVIGIAADNVRAVSLTWAGKTRRAQLSQNVFFVHRPISIASATHLPSLGRLRLLYRGGKPVTTVPLH